MSHLSTSGFWVGFLLILKFRFLLIKGKGTIFQRVLSTNIMEEIEQRWQRLSVTAEEEDAIQGKRSEKISVIQKGKKSLIGKLAGSKTANREALCRVMNMLWKPRKSLKVQEIGENLFIFEFTEERDKARVLGGCPWLFDRHLLLLHEFDGLTPPREFIFNSSPIWVQVFDLPLYHMTEEVGELIGNAMGRHIETEVTEDGVGWGKYLRVKTRIDISKPLLRKKRIAFEEINPLWVSFKYERLPLFCHACGIIGHGEKECVIRRNQQEQGGVGTLQYGAWLRADFHIKRSGQGFGPNPTTAEEEEDEVVAETVEPVQKEAGECSNSRRVGESEEHREQDCRLTERGSKSENSPTKVQEVQSQSRNVRDETEPRPTTLADRITEEREEEVLLPIPEGEKVPVVEEQVECGTFMDVELSRDDVVLIETAHSVSKSIGPSDLVGVLLGGKGSSSRSVSVKPIVKQDSISSQKSEKGPNQSKWRRMKERARNGEVLEEVRDEAHKRKGEDSERDKQDKQRLSKKQKLEVDDGRGSESPTAEAEVQPCRAL